VKIGNIHNIQLLNRTGRLLESNYNNIYSEWAIERTIKPSTTVLPSSGHHV